MTDATIDTANSIFYYDVEGSEVPRKTVTHVVISEQVRKLREYAFSNCDSLVEVSFPETLTEIDKYAFYECTSLTAIDLSKTTVDKIGFQAFWSCSSLVEVAFPETLTEIDGDAFQGCLSLVHVHVPKSLQTIGKGAFYCCKELCVISIPDHVHVSADSFKDCTLINEVKDQLKSANNSPIGDDYYFLYEKHRFANLPLHRACYDPNVTVETLTTSIQTALNDKSIGNVDVFSMNALHILCSNPNVAPPMLSTLITAYPSLCTMRSMEDMTPLMMFLRLKRLLEYDEDTDDLILVDRLSLRHCLANGVDWDVIELMLELDSEMRSEMQMKDEETGLYPFMEVAMNESNGSLKAMFILVYANPTVLFDSR